MKTTCDKKRSYGRLILGVMLSLFLVMDGTVPAYAARSRAPHPGRVKQAHFRAGAHRPGVLDRAPARQRFHQRVNSQAPRPGNIPKRLKRGIATTTLRDH